MKFVEKFNILGEDVHVKDVTVGGQILERFSRRYFQSREQYYESFVHVSINGDDDSDGTINHPVRTINKAFELSCNNSTAVNIKIIASGEYDLGNIGYSSLDIHLTTNVDNVVINLTDTNSCYNCHLNVGNTEHTMKIKSVYAPSYYWHFDGGQLYATNVIFECYLELNGCGGLFKNCGFSNVHIRVGNANFDSCYTIDNIRDDHGAIFSENAIITFIESFNTRLSKNSNVPLLQCKYGQINIATPFTSQSIFKYNTTFDINYAVILSSNDNYNSVVSMGTSEGTISSQKYLSDISVIGGQSGTEVYGDR